MPGGILRTASVFFINFGNDVEDSNGNVDNTWSVYPHSIPNIFTPGILGYYPHHARGVLDLNNEIAAGNLIEADLPIQCQLIFTGSTPFRVVMWANPDNYYVDVGGVLSFTLTSAMLTDSTFATLPGRFLFEVVANQECDFGWTWQIINSATPPTLTATPNYGLVALSWTSVSGATEYKIYRAPGDGSAFSLINTTSSLSSNDTAVVQGDEYSYYVTSVVSGNESPASNIETVTVLVIGTPTLTVTGTTTSPPTISLSWTACAGAVNYIILRGTTSGGEGLYDEVAAPTTTYTDVAPSAGVTYYYEVYAMGSYLNGPNSNEVNALIPVTNTLDFNNLIWTTLVNTSSFPTVPPVSSPPTSGNNVNHLVGLTSPQFDPAGDYVNLKLSGALSYTAGGQVACSISTDVIHGTYYATDTRSISVYYYADGAGTSGTPTLAATQFIQSYATGSILTTDFTLPAASIGRSVVIILQDIVGDTNSGLGVNYPSGTIFDETTTFSPHS